MMDGGVDSWSVEDEARSQKQKVSVIEQRKKK